MPRSLSILFVILALQHAYAELHQRSQSFNTMGSGLMQVRPHKRSMGTLRNSECQLNSANSKPSALAQLGKLRADHKNQRMVVESVQSAIQTVLKRSQHQVMITQGFSPWAHARLPSCLEWRHLRHLTRGCLVRVGEVVQVAVQRFQEGC